MRFSAIPEEYCQQIFVMQVFNSNLVALLTKGVAGKSDTLLFC